MPANESKNIPVRMDSVLRKKIDEAAKRTGLPKQEIIRICTAMGIEDLRRIGWKIAETLSTAADKMGKKPHLKALQKEESEEA